MRRDPGRSLSLVVDGKALWACHLAADGGYPWFHPVALPDGAALTAFSPPDHAWHRGLWFSWKFLNGVNFWEWSEKTPGIPAGITRRVGNENVRGGGNEDATLEMTLQYVHNEQLLLTEQRRIVGRLPRPDGSYVLDWTATFTAPRQEVVFDRTPPPDQPEGQGRAATAGSPIEQRKPFTKGAFWTVRAVGDAKGTASCARWMDLSGTIGDHGPTGGVAMFDHPRNPGIRLPGLWNVSPKTRASTTSIPPCCFTNR